MFSSLACLRSTTVRPTRRTIIITIEDRRRRRRREGGGEKKTKEKTVRVYNHVFTRGRDEALKSIRSSRRDILTGQEKSHAEAAKPPDDTAQRWFDILFFGNTILRRAQIRYSIRQACLAVSSITKPLAVSDQFACASISSGIQPLKLLSRKQARQGREHESVSVNTIDRSSSPPSLQRNNIHFTRIELDKR